MFVDTLRADAYFLRDLNVMDYSLLVCISFLPFCPQQRRIFIYLNIISRTIKSGV